MIPRAITLRLVVLGLIAAGVYAWSAIAVAIADLRECRAAVAWGATSQTSLHVFGCLRACGLQARGYALTRDSGTSAQAEAKP